MSLLMQALRKAERARSQNGHEAEAEAGQEQPPFGQDAVPSPPPMEGGPAFAVMPDAWRLEPLDTEPPVIPAQEAAHDPVPPQARHEPARSSQPGTSGMPGTAGADRTIGARGAAAAGARSARSAGGMVDDLGGGAGSSAGVGDDVGSGLALGGVAGDADAEGVNRKGAANVAGQAGARAAGMPKPARPGGSIGVDPAGKEPGKRGVGIRAAGSPRALASPQQRLVVLAGTLAALLAVFAFIYWRAVSAPGPGARLPMVPMPAPGSPQAAQGGPQQRAGIPVAPYVTAPAGDLAAPGGAAMTSGPAAPGVAPAELAAAGGAMAAPTAVAAATGAAAATGTAAGNAVAGDAMAGASGSTGGAAQGAVAPATKPKVDVTIPTPEQLAAIPDPAIRAEAMRDAAERAARQARIEGTSPPSSTAPTPPAAPASGIDVGTAASREVASANAAPGASPAEPGQSAKAAGHRPPRRSASRGTTTTAATGPGAGSGAAIGKVAGSGAGTAGTHGRAALTTAVGENGDVQFVRGAAATHVSPAVQNGYTALKQGDLATARQQYDQALLQDPNNRDALLGSAAVALREHDSKQASSNYLRLLELDPNDPEALAGLTELHPGDLQANEIKLKGLARQHPDSGPVQFALGNLLARQGRWPEAQQSYFRAFTAMPDNADYAFNLGVGLDRMNQPRLAQTYYRRALELAQNSPPTFNPDAVRKRLQALETPPR